MRQSAFLALAASVLIGKAYGLLDAGELTSVSASANAYDSRTSECSGGCVASNTRDGDYSDDSRWSCSSSLLDGEECNIEYDFSTAQDIVELWIAFTYGDERERSLEIWLDGVYHSTITSSGDTDSYEIFPLGSDETSTLTLVSTGLSSSEWLSITEVAIMVEGNLAYGEVGCYADSRSDRVLTYNSLDYYFMNPDLCALKCEGYAYFGTQYGRECWCGASGIDYDRHGAGSCNYACTGDSSTYCGGYYAFSLYAYDTDSSYIGCYADSRSDRVLTDKYTDYSLTPESCSSYCDGLGRQFYGLQYGNECWCGDCDLLEDGSSYDRHGETTCGMDCAGDSSETCGDYYAFNLYQIGSCD